MSRTNLIERVLSAAGKRAGARPPAHPLSAPPRAPEALEPLEPRTLLTTYTYEPLADAFDLDRLVRAIEPPAGGSPHFGAVVVALGDIDADGSPDFAISDPGTPPVLTDDRLPIQAAVRGRVHLYSGRTLSLIRTLDDGGVNFGVALANTGDLNADGVPDLAVGSPDFDNDADAAIDRHGRVWFFSGADGSVIRTLNGSSGADEFGSALANVGDVNDDGSADLIVGAPGAGGTAGQAGPGRALVLSGADGAVLFTFAGTNEAPGDRFGHAVAGGIDVPLTTETDTGDGAADYMVGAPGSDAGGQDAGRAYLFNGSDGSIRHTFTGEAAGDELGTAVEIVGAGLPNAGFQMRLLVGAPGHDTATLQDAGRVRRFGVTGLENVGTDIGDHAGARLGTAVYRIGRVISEENPSEQFVITAPGATGDHARLFLSTLSGPWITTVISSASSLARIGDADADGIIDLIAGFTPRAGEEGPGRAAVVPLTRVTAQPGAPVSSDNGRYFILNGPSIDGRAHGYTVADGVLTPYGRLPNLGDNAFLTTVNDRGLFFGIDAGDSHRPDLVTPTLDNQFFYQDGVKVSLRDAVRRIDGPAPAALRLVRLGNNGDAIFQSVGGDTARAYLFRAEVLSFLWNGQVSDINDSGVIVGVQRTDPGALGPTALLNADGSVTTIPGLLNGTAINDRGVVAGMSTSNNLAVWENGAVREIGSHPLPAGATDVSWTAADIDNTGRVIATILYRVPGPPPPADTVSFNYLYEPGLDGGFRMLDDAVTDEPTVVGTGRFTDDNRIVLLFQPAILIPSGDALNATVLPGSPRSAVSTADGLFVTAINQDGDAIILRFAAADWSAQTLPIFRAAVEGLPPLDDAITYTDARDGRAYAVVSTGDSLFWFRRNAAGLFEDAGALPSVGADITGPLTTFTTADGRAVLTATAADGDLIIIYQTNTAPPGDPANWAADNLSRDHLRAQGLDAPSFVGELTSYTTAWGGMTIAGLDDRGDIQAVWWAPGITLWSIENLSVRAGTPTLQGNLSSLVMPWGSIHISGTDAQGDLHSTWWAPGFGIQWRSVNLTDTLFGSQLNPGTLTSVVAPWGGGGGILIAGTWATQPELVYAYTWDAATGRWFNDVIRAPGITGPDRPLGRLTTLVTDEGQVNIFGRSADAEITRLFWEAGQPWTLENITELL